MGGNYKASHLRKTTGQVPELSGLVRIIHEHFRGSRNIQARGTGPEARGKDLCSEAQLFPLALSLAPIA